MKLEEKMQVRGSVASMKWLVVVDGVHGMRDEGTREGLGFIDACALDCVAYTPLSLISERFRVCRKAPLRLILDT